MFPTNNNKNTPYAFNPLLLNMADQSFLNKGGNGFAGLQMFNEYADHHQPQPGGSMGMGLNMDGSAGFIDGAGGGGGGRGTSSAQTGVGVGGTRRGQQAPGTTSRNNPGTTGPETFDLSNPGAQQPPHPSNLHDFPAISNMNPTTMGALSNMGMSNLGGMPDMAGMEGMGQELGNMDMNMVPPDLFSMPMTFEWDWGDANLGGM